MEAIMNEEKIKLIENKLKKMILPFDPVVRRINSANDWVESLKICIEEIITGLNSFSKPNIEESTKDDFLIDTGDKIYEISNLFQRIFKQYLLIIKKRRTPLSLPAQSLMHKEMVNHWRKLAVALESAKEAAKQIEGRAIMLNLWSDESFVNYRKFIERLKNSNVGEVQDRMKNAEFPLGDDLVSYED
jgi:hypothetical protein